MHQVQSSRLEAHGSVSSSVLDALAAGVLLIDGRGRVIGANQRARALVSRGDGLAVGADGRLAAASADDTRRIADVVDRALCRRTPIGGALGVPRGDGESSYAVVVAPAAHGSARAVVVVTDTGEEPALPVERAAAVLRLTRGEATVALGLAQGKTLEALAAELGVAVSTVRTHLKHVFAKTGTSQQSQVVSLVFRCGLGTLR
jgi:DNA-binding CsgD family transcriptional regulator